MAVFLLIENLEIILSHHLPDPLHAGRASSSGTPATEGSTTGASTTETPTTIVHAFTRSEYHYPQHTTPYLLVCNFGQPGHYRLNGDPIHTNEQLFYFLNAGDELEIRFDKRTQRETLLILFEREMVEQAAEALYRLPDQMLDDPRRFANVRDLIPPIPFAFTASFRQLIDRLRASTSMDNASTASHARQMLTGFFELCGMAGSEMRRLSSRRAATRLELYKRLLLARAFMEERVCESLSVGQIAREACLNQYYFIELFRTTFGTTPHQYLRKKKLEHAYSLLRTGNYSVTDACNLIGFQSLGSFTNLFRKTFGIAPSAVRS